MLLTCLPCLQIKAHQKEEAAREHEREMRKAHCQMCLLTR